MPYVSHPVRRVRDDPEPGETVDLVVRVADDADPDAVADALRELGAEGVEDRGLGAITAQVPQEAVPGLCERRDLASVETTDVLSMHLDGAGEDVEY